MSPDRNAPPEDTCADRGVGDASGFSWRSPHAAAERDLHSRGDPLMHLRDLTTITKALSDETRVRVLMAMQRGELCVCQIVELVGLATSTVSKHMSILKQARLVESRKDGRWIHYRRADPDAHPVVRDALDWIARSLAGDPLVRGDRQRVAAICTSDPQELCAARGRRDCQTRGK
jgi:ArsR family transcriptional regulator, arsenate/arsenite/antimonite-responsive transcriptional repressor